MSRNERRRERRREQRRSVIEHYGGRCECCGEDRVPFLALDHIHGGGTEHRRQVGRGSAMVAWIIRQGFPREMFRILCHNCNNAWAWGECPHKEG